MKKKQIELPVIDNQQSELCNADGPNPVFYEDPAGENWITDQLETAAGPVYRISTELNTKDLFGTIKARSGFGRMNYRIPPALYAVGEPDSSSPVLVSANYKLSFDHLRRELSSLNLWIMVIDTDGINVWCAAGKGSFGTDEVIRMLNATGLSGLISHRNLILPQLAAPGVSANEVRRRSGFKVNYGPVRAADIPAFLNAGNKAEAKMRRPDFNLADRLVLAPVELLGMFIPLTIFAAAFFLLNLVSNLIKGSSLLFIPLLGQTFSDLAPFLAAMLTGIILIPALLPFIPGRALAWKGWILGLIMAFIYTFLIEPQPGWLQTTAYFLTIPAISAFLGMNFTGSTTYTSLSGVVKEMGIALPLILVSAGLGLIALIFGYFI